MQQQKLDEIVLQKTGMPIKSTPELKPWKEFLARMKNATESVRIGLVGKYVELPDAYKSINEALFQAATYNDHKLDLKLIHSEKITKTTLRKCLDQWMELLLLPDSGKEA